MFSPPRHLLPTSQESHPFMGLQMGQHPAGNLARVRQHEDSGVKGLPNCDEQMWNASALRTERQCGDCAGDQWQAMG